MSDSPTPARDAAHAPPAAHAMHPPVSLYVKVIAALAIVTALEIVIILPDVKAYYRDRMPWFTGLVVPLLLGMSALKFGFVVAFFMHLKQDRGLPRAVFLVPLGLMALLVLVLMTLSGTLV